MKQKTIMFLGAGFEQTIAIDLARDLGLRVIALDANPEAVGLQAADVGVHGDIRDLDLILATAVKHDVDGIMAHGVEVPVTVATAARKLGLPGLAPDTADLATNKYRRLSRLRERGIPCPEFAAVASLHEARDAAAGMGYPLVIKPVDNSGARGIRLVRDERELAEAVEGLGAYTHSSVFLLEQYIEGVQISTESVIHEGTIHTTGFADRNYEKSDLYLPFFVEDGHSVPSTLPDADQERVRRVVEQTIRALDIDWGVAKGDIVVSERGVYVFEMAARTSGGWFASGTVPIATGVNILDPLIRMHVGLPVEAKDFQPRFTRAACQRYIIPDREGVLAGIHGVQEAFAMPGVRMALMFSPPVPGQKIGRARNHAERFGHIITEGADLAEAVTRCENAVAAIELEYE
ncbi:MAG: ATP-grasp domain-containing protein [bacterium]|nr:ATP-grasp domain-containing protein [bacterium]